MVTCSLGPLAKLISLSSYYRSPFCISEPNEVSPTSKRLTWPVFDKLHTWLLDTWHSWAILHVSRPTHALVDWWNFRGKKELASPTESQSGGGSLSRMISPTLESMSVILTVTEGYGSNLSLKLVVLLWPMFICRNIHPKISNQADSWHGTTTTFLTVHLILTMILQHKIIKKVHGAFSKSRQSSFQTVFRQCYCTSSINNTSGKPCREK